MGSQQAGKPGYRILKIALRVTTTRFSAYQSAAPSSKAKEDIWL